VAVDGHIPLNANEVMKAEDNGLNVRGPVEQIYAAGGFDSITADDLRGRLRGWARGAQRRDDHTGVRSVGAALRGPERDPA